MSKIPSFPFYIGDWMKDPALRSVTRAARGLWIDMLCLMWECPQRGVLARQDGSPFTADDLSRMAGGDEWCKKCAERYEKADKIVQTSARNRAFRNADRAHEVCDSCIKLPDLLHELSTAGVLSTTQNGAAYSRRMVREEADRVGNRNRQSEFRERHRQQDGTFGDAQNNADVTQPHNADVTQENPGRNANITGVGTPTVTDLFTVPAFSSSSTSSSSTSSTNTTPLETLVDLLSTQAPSATSPDQSPGVVSDEVEKPEERRPEDLKLRDSQIIEALFGTYCDELHRDRAKYTLTPIRKAKALLRLHERTKVRGSTVHAVEDMTTAIKNLAASEWHVTNGHIDWTDQIFRSAEEFEKRLNWIKPNGGNSHANSHETREQRNERRFQEALNRVDHDAPADDEQPETERDS